MSLDEYIKNMPEGQEDIYYITGDNMAALAGSPHLEQLKAKDYEVLLMTDPVDEWVTQGLTEYEGKKLKSAEKGDLKLDEDEKKDTESFNALFGFIKGKLEEKVKEVKPSARLKDSVACLSGDDHDMSAYMEKILKSSGQEVPTSKRVLELNTGHPLMAKINTLFESDRDNAALGDYSKLLYDLAVVGEGGKVDNPGEFSRLVGELMSKAID